MRSILMLQEKRYKEFLLTKRKVVALCNEMDYDPETSFERDLICEDDEAFQLSVENMASLKTVLHDVWAIFSWLLSNLCMLNIELEGVL